MVLKFLFVILGLSVANTIFANDCGFEIGRYAEVGGSEKYTVLEFFSDGKVVLEHENWMPGHYEDRFSERTFGTWSCRDCKVLVQVSGKEYSATLRSVGPNPLDIDTDTLVLHFLDTGMADDVVDGGSFYQEHKLD